MFFFVYFYPVQTDLVGLYNSTVDPCIYIAPRKPQDASYNLLVHVIGLFYMIDSGTARVWPVRDSTTAARRVKSTSSRPHDTRPVTHPGTIAHCVDWGSGPLCSII